MSDKNKTLIYYLVKGYHCLNLKDKRSILKILFPNNNEMRINMYRKIQDLSSTLNLRYAKTLPIILIVDEVNLIIN